MLEAWRLGGLVGDLFYLFVRLFVLLLDTFLLLARLRDLIYMNVTDSIDIMLKIHRFLVENSLKNRVKTIL